MSTESVKDVLELEFDDSEFKIDEIEGGESHLCYTAESENRQLFVKICDNDWSGLPHFEKGFEIEAPVMELVRGKTDIPVPEVTAFNNNPEAFDFKYIVTEKVEGRPMYPYLDYPENQDNIFLYGQTLAELHNKTQFEESGGLNYDDKLSVEPIEWEKIFKEMIWKLTDHLDKIEAYDFKERVRELVRQNRELLGSIDQPVLVHQEFSPRNILGNSTKINAVIDWERSISGDPELDLAIAEKHLLQKEDGKPEIRDNPNKVKEAFYNGYKSKREIRNDYNERKYLYYLPYITLMAYITADRENNEVNELIKKQLEEIEKALSQ